jgi:hypothetical protein
MPLQLPSVLEIIINRATGDENFSENFVVETSNRPLSESAGMACAAQRNHHPTFLYIDTHLALLGPGNSLRDL